MSAGAAVGDEVPDAVRPPPGNPRFPLFDALRAVAALLILLRHAASFSAVDANTIFGRLFVHLDVGVTIFFLISGFLLYRPMVAARILGTPATRIRDYATRRFLRIAPAYWLAITALAIYPGIEGVFSGSWWSFYTLTSIYPFASLPPECVATPLNCGIPPTWSLTVEVGFYICLPFFALGMAALRPRFGKVAWIWPELSVLAVLSLISLPLQGQITDDLLRSLWYSPIGRFWWFALGMALAAWSVRIEERGESPRAISFTRERPLVPWVAAGILYLAACFLILDPLPGAAVGRGQYTVEYLLFGVIAVLILLPAVFGSDARGLPQRLLGHRSLAWLGLVSYGIFLYHYPVLFALFDAGLPRWSPAVNFIVMTSVTLTITLACASVSYYALERPVMRLKSRLGRSKAG